MSLDLWTLGLQTVNLLVLLALLRWLLLKPLLAVIDARRSALEAERGQAREALAQARQQAQALAAERAALAGEGATRQAAARAEAEAWRAEAQAQAAQQAAALLQQARERLADERREATAGLLDEAAALATRLAGRVLAALPGDGSDAACAAALVARLGALPAAARREALAGASVGGSVGGSAGVSVGGSAGVSAGAPALAAGPGLQLATAAALPAEAATRLVAELQALVGTGVPVACAVDPSLLRGAELRAAHGVWSLHAAAELAAAREALRTAPTPDPTRR